MTHPKIYSAVVGGLLCLCTLSASAYNLRWLNYSPVRFFTDQDWELATEAGRKALNEAADGETVSWENTATGASGTLSPLSTSSGEAGKCRRLRISNNANGVSSGAVYEFCQRPDGTWGAVEGGARQPGQEK